MAGLQQQTVGIMFDEDPEPFAQSHSGAVSDRPMDHITIVHPYKSHDPSMQTDQDTQIALQVRFLVSPAGSPS